MITELNDKLSGTPNDPGVYIMKDGEGKVVYVGKAKNLKKGFPHISNNSDRWI